MPIQFSITYRVSQDGNEYKDEIRDIDPAEDTLKQCPGENISDSTVVVSDSVMI